jgi:hypothetical protein
MNPLARSIDSYCRKLTLTRCAALVTSHSEIASLI